MDFLGRAPLLAAQLERVTSFSALKSGERLVGGEDVSDGDGLVATRAETAGPDPPSPHVAVRAALVAEVSGLALGALEHGVGLGDDRFDGGRPLTPPRRLAADR